MGSQSLADAELRNHSFTDPDVACVGRLTRNGYLDEDSPFVHAVRDAVQDQRFDVQFEFQSKYDVPLKAETAKDAVLTLAEAIDCSRPPRGGHYMLHFIRLEWAVAYADDHLTALGEDIPDDVGHDTARETYEYLARTLQTSTENEVGLKSLKRRFDEENGYALGRAMGTTYSPDWDPAYLSALYTPAETDPVNAPLREQFGVGET